MLRVYSPAKINLFLRILGKREDGYHAFASLMQAIGIFDELHISLDSHDRLVCDDPRLPTDDRNLILKAAALFRKKTGLKTQFHISLTKRIPVEAGLGGGSSNGASALWGFNQLCGSPASFEQLREWSAELGSDMPFFFSSGSAYCTGRGEIVRSLPPLKSETVWVLKPQEGLSTKEVYAHLNLSLLRARDPEESLNDFLTGKFECFNDLEASAFSLKPDLMQVKKEALNGGFATVLLSGSGSSFFCLGNGKLLPKAGIQMFKTSFVHRSSDWYSP